MFLLLGQAVSFAKGIEIKADISKKTIDINDTFVYFLQVKGNFKKNPQIIVPKFKNFEIIQTIQNHSFDFVAGKLKVKIKYSLVLRPLKVGKFKLPKFKIKTFLKTYEADEVEVEVIGKKKREKRREKIQPQESGGKVWI
jgi:hypothetical protein